MLFLSLTLLLLIAYQEYKYGKMRKTIRHTPGPKMLPFVGNMFQLGKTPCGKLYYNYYEENKSTKLSQIVWPILSVNINI